MIFYRIASEVPPAAGPPPEETTPPGLPCEADFYLPFADYLVHGLEECTKAIPIGNNRLGPMWGNPDVYGIFQSRQCDFIRMPIEATVAEIKLNPHQLVTAFGQACAYKLFAHKSYLVVPRDAPSEGIDRLDALCLIFGIGLILFDATSSELPNFQIRVRAAKHEPDIFYANQFLTEVASDLGL